MGRYTNVYQDSTTNLQAGTKTGGEYVLPYTGDVVGGSATHPIYAGSSGNPYIICYYFEIAPLTSADTMEKFLFKVSSTSTGTPTIDWAVDLSSPAYVGAWVSWESGSLPALTAFTSRIDHVRSSVTAPIAGISPLSPAFPQFTQLRLSIRVNAQAGVTSSGGSLQGFRCFNSLDQEFCPKDLFAHVVAGAGSPLSFNAMLNSAISTIGDNSPGDITTFTTGNATMAVSTNSGLTLYIDTKKGSPVDKIEIVASFLNVGAIGISGSMDGAVWSTDYTPSFTTVPGAYTLYTFTNVLANVGAFRYYRIYVLDINAAAVLKTVSVSDLRLFSYDGSDYHDIFYSRYGPKFKSFR